MSKFWGADQGVVIFVRKENGNAKTVSGSLKPFLTVKISHILIK